MNQFLLDVLVMKQETRPILSLFPTQALTLLAQRFCCNTVGLPGPRPHAEATFIGDLVGSP